MELKLVGKDELQEMSNKVTTLGGLKKLDQQRLIATLEFIYKEREKEEEDESIVLDPID